jgi:hypothetical protein
MQEHEFGYLAEYMQTPRLASLAKTLGLTTRLPYVRLMGL